MAQIVFAFLLISLSFGRVMAVTGGETLQPAEFRQTVALAYKVSESVKLAEIFCSGTLIEPHYVLTAGHCIGLGAQYYNLSETEFIKHVWVYIGDSPNPRGIPLVEPNSKIDSAQWNFNPKQSKLDIALLKIQGTVDLESFKIQIAPPLSYNQLLADSKVTTVGYGGLNYGLVKGAKRKFTAGVMGTSNDRFWVGQTAVSNPTACHGDSGGSAYTIDKDGKTYLAGMTLEIEVGDECGQGKTIYQGFTPAILQWIDTARIGLVGF